MKKLILVLALVLVVSPAFATVTLTESAKSGTTVTVGYSYVVTGGFPRAFALNLVANGGTITSVTPAIVGESVAPSNLGYGIFPGTIVIDSNGVVTDDGTPVAPVGAPGAGGALPAASAVVELGSLYVGGPNAPAASGALFTVVCSAGTTSLDVSVENTYRGGVVDESANGLTVAPINITFAEPYAGTCWSATSCPRQTFGDANCDGNVNFSDLAALKAAWGAAGPPWVGSKCCADFTRDHAVNFADLARMKANWGTTGTGTATLVCPTIP